MCGSAPEKTAFNSSSNTRNYRPLRRNLLHSRPRPRCFSSFFAFLAFSTSPAPFVHARSRSSGLSIALSLSLSLSHSFSLTLSLSHSPSLLNFSQPVCPLFRSHARNHARTHADRRRISPRKFGLGRANCFQPVDDGVSRLLSLTFSLSLLLPSPLSVSFYLFLCVFSAARLLIR